MPSVSANVCVAIPSGLPSRAVVNLLDITACGLKPARICSLVSGDINAGWRGGAGRVVLRAGRVFMEAVAGGSVCG